MISKLVRVKECQDRGCGLEMRVRMRDKMTVLAGDILLLILLVVAVHAYLSCALGFLGCGCNDGVLKDCLVFQIGSGGT